MNQKTALALTIAASAAAGALVTAAVNDTRITNLKKKLSNAEFKNRLLQRAADAMLDEIPDERVGAVNKKIRTDYEFEVLTSRI
jgi:hypothetical protein